jgi:hypothetical protein
MTRGDDRRDPLIALRIPAPLKAQLYAEAEATNTTVSSLVRACIERELLNNQPPRVLRIPRATACQHRIKPGAYCRRCQRIV